MTFLQCRPQAGRCDGHRPQDGSFLQQRHFLLEKTPHDGASGIEDIGLKAIIHELPDFFYVKDRDSRFVFVNTMVVGRFRHR
jgi:hypothetical protein